MWATTKTNFGFVGEKDDRFKDEANSLPSPTKNASALKENKEPKYHNTSTIASSAPAVKDVLVAKVLRNRF